MRIYFQVQSEFSVQNTMKKFFLIDNHHRVLFILRGTTEYSSCKVSQFFFQHRGKANLYWIFAVTQRMNRIIHVPPIYILNLGWTFVHFCSDRLWRQKVKHVLDLKQFKEEEIVIWYHVFSVNRFPQARLWYVTFRYFSLVIKALKTMRW